MAQEMFRVSCRRNWWWRRFGWNRVCACRPAGLRPGRNRAPGRSHVPTRRSCRRHHHPGRRQLDGRAGAAGWGAIAASVDANKERYAAVTRQIWGRILKAAEGAALGAGTRVEHQVVTTYWNVLPNQTLATVQHRNLQRVGGVEYTADEQAFAERLRATLISPAAAPGSQSAVQPLRSGAVAPASTDMGDLSWNVPTVQMNAATFAPGVPAHSWQAVACAGSSIGIKGMLVAAKTMALTASDLYSAPATIAAAKEEFLRRRGGAGFKYSTLAPAQPPLDYRK